MPRTTHPTSRHRHDRGRLRAQTDRIVERRRKAVRRQVDDRFGGGLYSVGVPRTRLEDYLRASSEEVSHRWINPNFLSRWTWIRVRQLSDRQARFGWFDHDCWWGPGECPWCEVPRSRTKRALEAEIRELLAGHGGWRAELCEQADAGANPDLGT